MHTPPYRPGGRAGPLRSPSAQVNPGTSADVAGQTSGLWTLADARLLLRALAGTDLNAGLLATGSRRSTGPGATMQWPWEVGPQAFRRLFNHAVRLCCLLQQSSA